MMVVGVASADSLTANVLTVASNALDPVRMIGFGSVVVSLHITCADAARAPNNAVAAASAPTANRLRRVMSSSRNEFVCVRQHPYPGVRNSVNDVEAGGTTCCLC